jgi:hypothetical protein
MRLRTDERVRDVLLGPETRTGGGVAIIDWRSAPLAEVFFSCAEGDDYEIDADERTLTGTLIERSLVSFAQGELCEIETAAGRVRLQDGAWHLQTGPTPALNLRPEAARLRSSSPADVILDAAQRRVVELPAGKAVFCWARLASARPQWLCIGWRVCASWPGQGCALLSSFPPRVCAVFRPRCSNVWA